MSQKQLIVQAAAAATDGNVAALARLIGASSRAMADWKADTRKMFGPVRLLLHVFIAVPEARTAAHLMSNIDTLPGEHVHRFGESMPDEDTPAK